MSLLKRCLVFLLLAYSIVHVIHSLTAYKPLGDFLAHREDMTRWIEKGALQGKRPSLNSFDYTTAAPLHGLLVVPLTYVPQTIAVLINGSLNFLLVLIIFYWGSLKVSLPNRKMWWLCSFVLIANFRPFLLGLSMVKIEFIEVFFMVYALHLYRNGKDYGAGAALGFASLIKYFPGFLLFFFLAKREWKVVKGFAGGVVLTTLVTLSLFGWEHHVSFAKNLLSGQSWSNWIDNQSMNIALTRLLSPFDPQINAVTSAQPEMFKIVIWMLRITFGLILFYLTSGKVKDRNKLSWELEAACWLAFAPIFIHFFRDYYLMLFFPFIMTLTTIFLESPPRILRQKIYWGSLIVAYILMGQGFPIGIFTRLPDLVPNFTNFHLFLYLSIPFWGILIYLVISMWALKDRKILFES